MTIPEPGRIVNTQPMTVDRRWPPARHSPSPVTQPRTNVTARSTLPSTPSSKSTTRASSNGSKPRESHYPTSSRIGETTGRFALLGEYWCGRCQVRCRRKRGQSAVDLMRLGALRSDFRPGIRVSYRHGAPQPSRRTRPSRAIPDTSLQTARDVLGVCMLLSGTRAGRHEMVSSKGFKNASTSLTRLQCTQE